MHPIVTQKWVPYDRAHFGSKFGFTVGSSVTWGRDDPPSAPHPVQRTLQEKQTSTEVFSHLVDQGDAVVYGNFTHPPHCKTKRGSFGLVAPTCLPDNPVHRSTLST
jgi:hypothetical protein